MDLWDLHDQYYQPIRKFVLALVKDEWAADDLTQETFIKAQRNLDSIRDISQIRAWLFRIAYNLCQDHFRDRKKRNSFESHDPETTPLFESKSALKMIEQFQMSKCVQDKMESLPEPLRSTLILYDIMEFNHREVAEILDISAENAKVRLHRARKRLKLKLKKECSFSVDERNVLVCEPVSST